MNIDYKKMIKFSEDIHFNIKNKSYFYNYFMKRGIKMYFNFIGDRVYEMDEGHEAFNRRRTF